MFAQISLDNVGHHFRSCVESFVLFPVQPYFFEKRVHYPKEEEGVTSRNHHRPTEILVAKPKINGRLLAQEEVTFFFSNILY